MLSCIRQDGTGFGHILDVVCAFIYSDILINNMSASTSYCGIDTSNK